MRVSIYTAVVAMVTVALAAVTVLTSLGRGDQQLIAILLGFVGTNITALVAVYHSVKTRDDLRNGAVKEPVKEALREIVEEVDNES